MNLSELQTLVNYRRREVTESFISNDEITAYLCEANRKVGANYEYEWAKTSATFTYTDGSNRYSLSAVASDLSQPINMFYTDDYNFTQLSPENFMRVSSHNTDVYAIDGDYLLMNASFGDGIISLNYYSTNLAETSGGSWIDNLSSSDDEPLLPERYQDMLVDFAAARCYQKEGMYDDYRIAYADFRKALETLQRERPSRKRYASKIIRSTRKPYGYNMAADKSDPLNQL